MMRSTMPWESELAYTALLLKRHMLENKIGAYLGHDRLSIFALYIAEWHLRTLVLVNL